MPATEMGLLAFLTIATLSTGCATGPYQAYPGPKLPGNETARISADRASIMSIDGMALPKGRAFMLRAGVHAVSATGIDVYGNSIGLMTLCLAAEGGANYQVRLAGAARSVPEIYELDKGSVARTLLITTRQDCAPLSRDGTLVAVTLPPGARAHRGVPPPDPWQEHQVVSPLDWIDLILLPRALLLGIVMVICGGGRAG